MCLKISPLKAVKLLPFSWHTACQGTCSIYAREESVLCCWGWNVLTCLLRPRGLLYCLSQLFPYWLLARMHCLLWGVEYWSLRLALHVCLSQGLSDLFSVSLCLCNYLLHCLDFWAPREQQQLSLVPVGPEVSFVTHEGRWLISFGLRFAWSPFSVPWLCVLHIATWKLVSSKDCIVGIFVWHVYMCVVYMHVHMFTCMDKRVCSHTYLWAHMPLEMQSWLFSPLFIESEFHADPRAHQFRWL